MLTKDSATCVRLSQFHTLIILIKILAVFLKLGKLDMSNNCSRKRVPNFWSLVKHCEFFEVCSAMIHAGYDNCWQFWYVP